MFGEVAEENAAYCKEVMGTLDELYREVSKTSWQKFTDFISKVSGTITGLLVRLVNLGVNLAVNALRVYAGQPMKGISPSAAEKEDKDEEDEQQRPESTRVTSNKLTTKASQGMAKSSSQLDLRQYEHNNSILHGVNEQSQSTIKLLASMLESLNFELASVRYENNRLRDENSNIKVEYAQLAERLKLKEEELQKLKESLTKAEDLQRKLIEANKQLNAKLLAMTDKRPVLSQPPAMSKSVEKSQPAVVSKSLNGAKGGYLLKVPTAGHQQFRIGGAGKNVKRASLSKISGVQGDDAEEDEGVEKDME